MGMNVYVGAPEAKRYEGNVAAQLLKKNSAGRPPWARRKSNSASSWTLYPGHCIQVHVRGGSVLVAVRRRPRVGGGSLLVAFFLVAVVMVGIVASEELRVH